MNGANILEVVKATMSQNFDYKTETQSQRHYHEGQIYCQEKRRTVTNNPA